MALPFTYKPIVNNIALDRLSRPLHIPDAELMIGSTECLEPLPLLIYANVGTTQGSPVMLPYNKLSLEKAAETLQGTSITTDDFPGNTFYLGDATGAV